MVSGNTRGLELNVAPIKLSNEDILVGKQDVSGDKIREKLDELRSKYWRSHAFRYDNRVKVIYDVPIIPDVSPIGTSTEVPVQENLLLVAKAIQQSILVWIEAKGTPILQAGKRLTFWGQTAQALLLTQAIEKYNEQKTPGLEVALKYEIDCRVFHDPTGRPFLGFVIDVATSNVLDISISELLNHNYPIVGKFVSRRREFEHDYLKPKLEILGRVQSIRGTRLILTDTEIVDEVDTSEVFVEPRIENVEEAIRCLYKSKGGVIINELRSLRRNLVTAEGKRNLIRQTVVTLNNKRDFVLSNKLTITVEATLKPQHDFFPETISTERPNLLFGPNGRSSGLYPDIGVTTHGPFMYMLHERNTPLIAIICEKSERGRMEQFLEALRYGYDDKLWNNQEKSNPFPNGLIGKFRLSKIEFELEECTDRTGVAYKAAVKRLLERTSRLPDLAIVQIRENYRNLPTHQNPYYVSKAAFMMAGVPTQDIQAEKLHGQGENLAYLLNTIALSTYAKLDGTPWAIATHRPSTYEIVVGLGSTEVATSRVGVRKRYVGITTMFQGDGLYLVWGLTREVEFDEYAQALLSSLQTTIRHVQSQNGWQEGDKIRLVCHVYKRLKDCEVDAIKKIVRELIDQRFVVEFAFLDISEEHLYHIFDNNQQGSPYWVNRKKLIRGKGVPERGICLQLDERRALLHLTSAKDLKTDFQGVPKPLLIELHPDSDFRDMTYLARQVFHFSFMSWRSFFPATQPVTIKYSQLIANLLANLKFVDGWDSAVLSVGSLRGRRWFL